MIEPVRTLSAQGAHQPVGLGVFFFFFTNGLVSWKQVARFSLLILLFCDKNSSTFLNTASQMFSAVTKNRCHLRDHTSQKKQNTNNKICRKISSN